MAKTVIVISGPTAIGKTSLAIRLAQHYQTEIISADSRQFYREMEIGTAKPSAEELKAVKHYFINTLSVSDTFTVGDFEKQSLDLLDILFKKHDHVIVAGGSGLFINAIVRGFDELPQSSQKVRNHLNQIYSEKGIEYLQEKLKQVDPAFYLEVDIHNPQRLIRALEVYEITGKPFSGFRNRAPKKRPFNIIEIGLNTDRKTLYERINTRVDVMITDGLVQEVESLQRFRRFNALNTVGYAELFNYFDGNSSLEQAIEKIKQNTRRFAKRQLTWFNKSANIKWFGPQDFEQIVNYVESLQTDPEPSGQKS